MLSRAPLRYAAAVCLLHATISSGITPKVIDNSSVHTAVFSFLIIFSILTGVVFLLALQDVLWPPGPGAVPVEIFVYLYDKGHLFHWLSFFAVSTWLVQLTIFAAYIHAVFMRERDFPDSAYIAQFMFGKLADVFIAASVLQLVHYRRMINNPPVPQSSPIKGIFDFCLVVIHLGVAGYTTAFLALSTQDPGADNKYLNWLTSYYVYTGVYVLVMVNVTVTVSLYKKALRANLTANPLNVHTNVTMPRQVRATLDRVFQYSGAIIGSLLIHALFKVIMAVLFSQFNNPKINYDVFRIFEVIVLDLTYFIAMLLLVR